MKYINYLNQYGDITIAWDEDAHEEMLPVIERQMEAGMTFWEVTPRLGGIIPPKKNKLSSVDDINDERILSMKDDDFFKLVADGLASAIEPKKEGPLKFLKRLKKPKEVIQSKESVALKPMKGG